MSIKILELTQKLESVDFVNRNSQKGHRNYQHPKGVNITIYGSLNQKAKHYQIKDVKCAIDIVCNE